MTNDEQWRARWEEAVEEDDPGHDFVSELRSAVEYGRTDPENTLSYAFTAAEAAEATRDALAGEWALYTPEQAATVASALLAQLSAGAEALKLLNEQIEAMERRGEVEIPEEYTFGVDENIVTGMDASGTVAEGVEDALVRHADTVVGLMAATPSKVELPADPHDTLVRLVALMGTDGKLIEREHPGDLAESYAQGFGCGCRVAIQADGSDWTLHRGDSEWSLFSSDAVDGNGIIHKWTELSVTDGTPHPAHMLVALRAALAKAGQDV